MAKGIVMLHGANAGGWCFERFRTVFESLGWTCHTPDLIGHGNDRANSKNRRRWYGGLLRSATVISDVVRCAARHPRALYGSVSHNTREPDDARAILTTTIPPNFELAVAYSLNRVRREEQAAVFDKFVPESGRALFELFFWMLSLRRRQPSTSKR